MKHRAKRIHSATFFALIAGAVVSSPVRSEIVTYRADGVISGLLGVTSLLPLSPTTAVGDTFRINFSFDTDALDDAPSSAAFGLYSAISMSFAAGSDAPVALTQPEIHLQTDPFPNLWGISGCLLSCASLGTDQARLNLFFPAGTIDSDDLTLPPDWTGAMVQFGLFSSDGTREAFAIADLNSLTPVPLPAAGWLLISGLGGLVAIARRRSAPMARAVAAL